MCGTIIDSGNSAVVQPYLASVTGSETALIHIDGQFSHSVSKGPMLRRDGGGQWVEGLYLAEDIDHREVSEQQLVVARAALEAAPPGDVLYARVDLVNDDNGAPMVLELELIEPSLFFSFDQGSAQKMADAIVARIAAVTPKRDWRPAHRICARGNGKVTSDLVPNTVMTRIGAR